ncbi:MAG: alginate O-acetyltransferase [Romboutsia sp.]
MKRIQILKIVLFIGIITLPIINMNLKPEQVSEIDNRVLMEKSEVLTGDFTSNFEQYIEDRIGFRTSMISAYTNSMDYMFNYMVHPTYEYGQEGYIYSKLSREVFHKDFQEVYSDYILNVQQYCEGRGIEFLYAVEPSKATVYPEFLPKGCNYKNIDLDYFLKLLDEKNINHVYTGDALIEAKSNYQVFDEKFDAGHWNETGAIVGSSEILYKLNEQNENIDKFDFNNYEVVKYKNTSLPVSRFEIDEETLRYELIEPKAKPIDMFAENIRINERYTNFSHYKNEENTDAPRILVFAGSYFNNKDKFLTKSFSEYVKVHNYHNIIDIDYYINLFNPDIVLFESTEYTHNSNYFNTDVMCTTIYNKPLKDYENISKTQFVSIDGDITTTQNEAVIDFSIPLTNNKALYSYAKVSDRILDCEIIEVDGKQSVEFSIALYELKDVSEFTLYIVSEDESEYSEIKVNL